MVMDVEWESVETETYTNFRIVVTHGIQLLLAVHIKVLIGDK